jgi:hypothetical protein
MGADSTTEKGMPMKSKLRRSISETGAGLIHLPLA